MLYYTKKILKELNIDLFISCYFNSLQGAAIFVKNDKSIVSKVVSRFCKKKYLKNINLCDELVNFIPSHIASVYKDNDNDLYLLDIKPPKSTKQKLIEYLKNTKDDYVLILRRENLDLEKYNKYMRERVGLLYGLVSAVQSIFKYITFLHGMHCSENYIYAYNQQGFYYDINANKATPLDLMYYLYNKYNLGGI